MKQNRLKQGHSRLLSISAGDLCTHFAAYIQVQAKSDVQQRADELETEVNSLSIRLQSTLTDWRDSQTECKSCTAILSVLPYLLLSCLILHDLSLHGRLAMHWYVA